MIDHITIGVGDYEKSVQFYDGVLETVGATRLVTIPPEQSEGVKVAGYGCAAPWFWVAEERMTTGLLHIAFRATSEAQVRAFHAAALHAGGIDNGLPGLRPQYHENYFAAFVRDPDGHNIEAVFHG